MKSSNEHIFWNTYKATPELEGVKSFQFSMWQHEYEKNGPPDLFAGVPYTAELVESEAVPMSNWDF